MYPESPRPTALAYASGYSVVRVDAPVLVNLLVDKRQIVVQEQPELRDVEGDVALAFARALLLRKKLCADRASIDCVARALCMPPSQFAADWSACGGCHDTLANEYPFVPIDWLADAIEALETAPVARIMHLQLVGG